MQRYPKGGTKITEASGYRGCDCHHRVSTQVGYNTRHGLSTRHNIIREETLVAACASTVYHEEINRVNKRKEVKPKLEHRIKIKYRDKSPNT